MVPGSPILIVNNSSTTHAAESTLFHGRFIIKSPITTLYNVSEGVGRIDHPHFAVYCAYFAVAVTVIVIIFIIFITLLFHHSIPSCTTTSRNEMLSTTRASQSKSNTVALYHVNLSCSLVPCGDVNLSCPLVPYCDYDVLLPLSFSVHNAYA